MLDQFNVSKMDVALFFQLKWIHVILKSLYYYHLTFEIFFLNVSFRKVFQIKTIFNVFNYLSEDVEKKILKKHIKMINDVV